MPKFQVRIWREVVETEFFTREIEASDRDAALAQAETIAAQSRMSAPDDVQPGDTADFGSWNVDWADQCATCHQPDCGGECLG
ncbi:hypothetical protein [Stakelama pacifica]|uniref:Uncharacterized protein n=1 Tax=Stakelama pacifica TaxID=517720 RepID=A0A4R6FN25_9SPHN|nr:hypothetical protein [Stakelama pacifica]TDN82992.1 hypothetical protein EV664_105190 [Stakelama pacifica]GGO94984.1 hypothetical protein GCM10011329_18100 [Stakelama pacifica]